MLSPLVRFFLPTCSEGFLMFGIGSTELIVVAIVVLVLFGSRIPQTMKSLGMGLAEFKKGVNSDVS
jgi:sec-independent protein translocase protein TatA